MHRIIPFGIILLILLTQTAIPTIRGEQNLVIKLTPEGKVKKLEAYGYDIHLNESYILWTRELTNILFKPNILSFHPSIVKKPKGCQVDITDNTLNLSFTQQGKAVVKVGSAQVNGGKEYAFSALFSGWNGFIDVGGGLYVEVVALWRLRSGGKHLEKILIPQGSTPTFRRFTNITISPEDAEMVEVYLISNAPPINTKTWIAMRIPIMVMLSEEAKWKPVSLTLSKKTTVSEVYVGLLNDIEYTLEVGMQKTHLTFNITIKNNQNRKRAIDVALTLPIYPEEWKIWINPRIQKPIRSPIYTETINSLASGGYLPTSLYPLSVISNKEITIGYAIPLDKPTISTFSYRYPLGYTTIFPVGLTEATTKHSKASLECFLYVSNGKEGMRNIMKQYIEEHPEWFKPNITVERNVKWELAKYGLTFYQAKLQYPTAAKIVAEKFKNLNIYIAQYILPWEYEPISNVPIESNPPSYWYIVKLIQRDQETKTPVGLKALASNHTAPTDENGYIIVSALRRGPNYRPDEWVPKIPMNPDPDIPYYNVWCYTLDILNDALSNAEEYGISIDGIELDSFLARSGHIDLKREAIEALDHNLVYDPNTFQPAVHLSYAAIEYLTTLRRWMKENMPWAGLTGNFVAEGYASYASPYLDAIPFECSPQGFNWEDNELLYRRFIAGNKTIIGVATFSVTKNPELLDEFINKLVFYGITPMLKLEDYSNEGILKEYGQLLSQAYNVSKTLNKAGWRPVTKIHSDDLLVERFGDWPRLYLTIYNPYDEPKPIRVEVEAYKDGEYEVSMLWGEASIEMSIINRTITIFGDKIDSRKTIVLLLAYNESNGPVNSTTIVNGEYAGQEQKTWNKHIVLATILLIVLILTIVIILKRSCN